jgi:hypothetical protein
MPFVRKNLAAVVVDDEHNAGPSASNCLVEMEIEEPQGKVIVDRFPAIHLGNITLEPVHGQQGHGQYRFHSGDLQIEVPVEVHENGRRSQGTLRLSTMAEVKTPNRGSFKGSPVEDHTHAIGNVSLVGEIPSVTIPILFEGDLNN